jgi:hypothetical protein
MADPSPPEAAGGGEGEEPMSKQTKVVEGWLLWDTENDVSMGWSLFKPKYADGDGLRKVFLREVADCPHSLDDQHIFTNRIVYCGECGSIRVKGVWVLPARQERPEAQP